jgi:hypothetical protein
MIDDMSGVVLRRWAIRCATKAASTSDRVRRDELKRMAAALSDLADTQDWLDGRSLEYGGSDDSSDAS